MTNPFSPENDPFSYQEGTEWPYEVAQEVVGSHIEEEMDALTTKLGILAQYLCSEVQDGGKLANDLVAYEFFLLQIQPVNEELNDLLDW